MFLALFAIGLAWLAAGSARSEEKKYGYDDTPKLPNSQWRVHDRDRPQPPMVAPGEKPGDPPADAIVLFDGKSLDRWIGGTANTIQNGAIDMLKTDGLETKQQFGDCQLHAEWATPAEADGNAMNWGNSGIFFMGLYELQIIESHAGQIYSDGIAGAIYGQTPPLVNASRKPGQWQTFDAVFQAPKFDGEKLVEPARLTVFWNGVLVQYCQPILGSTQHKMLPAYTSHATTGPLTLQRHNSAVRLRNIWIRPLSLTCE